MASTASEAMRISVADTHDVVSQERFLLLHFLHGCLQRIARIEDADRPGQIIRDWVILQLPLLHDAPDVVQPILLLTARHIPRHDGEDSRGATGPKTLADLRHDV